MSLRLVAHGLVLLVVLLMAQVAHADESTDDTSDATLTIPDAIVSAADKYSIDVMQLWGAVNTETEMLGRAVDPLEYLCWTGDAPCPRPTLPTPDVSSVAYGVWDRLQQCEAPGGGWRTNTGNGYYGGVQEDMTFWRNYGGLAFAARPDLASREAQIIVAQRGLAKQGWGAWPVCSRRLGLR